MKLVKPRWFILPLLFVGVLTLCVGGWLYYDHQTKSGDTGIVLPSKTSYKYIGSIQSDKYHYPSCRWAKNIHEENEIWFTSSLDARSHGYAPCGTCKPP